MLRLTLLLTLTFFGKPASGQLHQQYSPLTRESSGAALTKITQGDFKSCLIASPKPDPVLFAKEEWLFSGDAKKLSAFLGQIAKLPHVFRVTIYLTGPAASGIDPLTSGAAQTAVNYDWKVQTLNTTQVSIFIPLASRVPFEEIQFPAKLRIEAYPEVRVFTKNFIRLRDNEAGDVPNK